METLSLPRPPNRPRSLFQGWRLGCRRGQKHLGEATSPALKVPPPPLPRGETDCNYAFLSCRRSFAQRFKETEVFV